MFALMRFQLVEHGLNLPAMRVGEREIGRRGHGWVQDRGDQLVVAGAAIVDGVVDDPDDQPVTAPFEVADLEHLGQIRAVGEDLDRVETLTGAHPPQQVGTRRPFVQNENP